MTRTGVLILAVLVMLPGTALAQGLLDSIFGSGGLGLWGSQPGNQFDSPQYYGGTPAPGQQGLPSGYGNPQQGVPQAQGYAYPQQGVPQAQGYAYPQQGAPQAQSYTDPQQGAPQAQSYTYPQQDYAQQAYPQGQAGGYPQGYGNQGYSWQGSTQQGIYSDWQGYQQPVPAPPPVQYTAPQAQQAAPPARYVAPQAQTPVTQQRRPSGGPTGPVAAQPMQAAPGQGSGFDDDLPAGAVKITTITPDGTTVQYYGPPGEQAQPQPAVTQPQQRARSSAARKPRSGKPPTAGAVQGAPKQKPASRVAMPKPVQIPQGSDPRAGWSVAVDRAPAAPEVTGNTQGPRRQTGR